MTVHNFLKSISVGETVTIPKNCNFESLKNYAYSRFDYCLIKIGNDKIMRVCPTCFR